MDAGREFPGCFDLLECLTLNPLPHCLGLAVVPRLSAASSCQPQHPAAFSISNQGKACSRVRQTRHPELRSGKPTGAQGSCSQALHPKPHCLGPTSVASSCLAPASTRR